MPHTLVGSMSARRVRALILLLKFIAALVTCFECTDSRQLVRARHNIEAISSTSALVEIDVQGVLDVAHLLV